MMRKCFSNPMLPMRLLCRSHRVRWFSEQGKAGAEIPWIVGQSQPLPFESNQYKSYLANDLKNSGGLYSFLVSAVIPRPIALVSSLSKDGVLNCAPFSYFNMVCHDPPLVVLGFTNNVRSKTKKDTLSNIEETGDLYTFFFESSVDL
jgi:hypothetical protein